jgi:glycosyltransferase involved in cell wall biosynthesis
VIVPCYNDGRYLSETLASIREEEPVEVVVVDDASTDQATAGLLTRLEARGIRVVRHAENRGLSAARMTGMEHTAAPYLFPLDADDLLIPGTLGAMADVLDANPALAACYGDHVQFGADQRIIRAPQRLEPYRLAYRNEYPGLSLLRRTALEEVGGWRDVNGEIGYEDWHLWMTLAEHGCRASHVAPGTITFERRMHGSRMLAVADRRHGPMYAALRQMHPDLFERLPEYRKASTVGSARSILYPTAYRARPRRGIYLRLRRIASQTGLMALAERPRGRRQA